MTDTRVPFEPGLVYHVYHHGNSNDNIFREDENYYYFLKKYRQYLSSISYTYAYCLLPNHFHVLIRFEESDCLLKYFQNKFKGKREISNENLHVLISDQFKNFLISYSKSFNKKYSRKGSLFIENLKRKAVYDEIYFTTLIRYIHFNPVFHGFTEHPAKWKFSSIYDLSRGVSGIVALNEVYKFFGGRNRAIDFHKMILQDEVNQIKHLV